ncbi:hypothetical protein HJFPF1_07400 [Paramyrothecium foliicola]|nr:hypothetical protein HJFPF1_07400 [Paramyrothecium foliicola]
MASSAPISTLPPYPTPIATTHTNSQVNLNSGSPPSVYEGMELAERAESTASLYVAPEEKVAVQAREERFLRQRYYVLAAVAVILAIVGIIFGGVFGTKDNYGGSREEDSAQDGGTSHTESTSITTITSISTAPVTSTSKTTSSASFTSSLPTASPTDGLTKSIAAVGWKGNDGVSENIFVVSQDSEGILQYTRSDGSGSYARQQPLSTEYDPKLGSPITMSALVQLSGEKPAIQLELFYLNDSSVVNGINYNEEKSSNGFGYDSINSVGFTSVEGGSMAAYWPLILFQDMNAHLQLILFDGVQPWSSFDLSILAMDQTELAIVPITRNYTRVLHDGWIGLFYQDTAGKLIPRANPRDTVKGGAKELAGLMQWWSIDRFPEIVLPEKASFAAFSIGRSDDDDTFKDEVNTYVLYQDGSSDIKLVWLDNDEEGWQQSSPEALKGADAGTDIACITSPTWPRFPVVGENLLAPASDLTRCYFHKNGNLVETQFLNNEWQPTKPVFPTLF